MLRGLLRVLLRRGVGRLRGLSRFGLRRCGSRLRFATNPNTDQKPGPLQNLAQFLTQIGTFAELLGQDMSGPQKCIGPGRNLPIRIGEIGGTCVQIGTGGVCGQNFPGQRLQPAFPSLRGKSLLPRFERQIEVFQPLRSRRGKNLFRQRLGELPLRLDGSQDRLLPIRKLAKFFQPALDVPNLLFIQAAGLVLAISRNEGNRVALVQQLHHCLNLPERDAQASCNMP